MTDRESAVVHKGKAGSDKAKSADAFKAVWAYAKPHRITFVGIFLCALLGISADLLQPYLVKVAICFM